MTPKNKIKVDVHFNPAQLDELDLKDKNVVVIDVLRASTTVATALQNGAKEIIPVSDIESAVKISASLFGDVVLRGGERNGKPIEGFDLGNSPAEYFEEKIKNKSIIFITTNGSRAIVRGRYAKNLFVASFVNLSVIVSSLLELRSDITIVCAGKENKFCLEDTACAGKMIAKLSKELKKELIFDDAGAAALALDKTYGKNIFKTLQESEHGQFLSGIGYEDDLKICAQVDSVPVVPMLAGNVIRLKKPNNA